MSEEIKYKCVSLKGEFENMGNHILLPFGVTLCGLPTTDASIKDFPQLTHHSFDGMISEYKEEPTWEITCEKCLAVFKILEAKKEMLN